MKQFKLFLILVLIFPLIANAGTINTSGEDANINVVVGEVEGSSTGSDGEVVSEVEINWKQMTFTYNVVETYTWDSETHKYVKGNPNTYWTNNGNTITVANKTANQVVITPKYFSKVDYVTGKFDTNKVTLESHASKTLKFQLEGSIEAANNNAKVGYITIEIE